MTDRKRPEHPDIVLRRTKATQEPSVNTSLIQAGKLRETAQRWEDSATEALNNPDLTLEQQERRARMLLVKVEQLKKEAHAIEQQVVAEQAPEREKAYPPEEDHQGIEGGSGGMKG